MDNIEIAATERGPAISFDFAQNVFSVTGESYPEDVAAFYKAPIDALQTHLAAQSDARIEFRFELIYFNSSTAKVLMNLFDALDEAASNGNSVKVIWAYESDDDNMQELGEEFGEDLEHATFEAQPIES